MTYTRSDGASRGESGAENIGRGHGLFVDEDKLSHEEVKDLQMKTLEGLDAIHECNVEHNDLRFDNMRLEKKNGMFHVWWIALGVAYSTDYDGPQVRERFSVEEKFVSFLL